MILGWTFALLPAAGLVAAAEPVSIDFFERHIRPVLVEHCHECHSATSRSLKGGLRLDTRAGMLQGGDSGLPAILPGDAMRSQLITAIGYQDDKLQMPPPKHGGRLRPDQVVAFVAWVNAGAPDPRTETAPVLSASSSAANHWAFQPVRDSNPPPVRNQVWPQTPVDRFILAKFEPHGLRPAPMADPRTLIRRMTYDLTGLPPTSGEVERFAQACRADRAGAIATLIERLLASPQYGERWARHWLDVARYSDTKGYVYGREERFFVHAWAYRDWVVRALNEDLPYDRFLQIQIAADQLVPAHSPDLAAMGFLTGGRRFIGVTHDIIDDRIDVVTRGTMALTVQCARCHDHKYDPIPTADYYSLYGVFHHANEQLVRLQPAENVNSGEAFEKEYAARVKKRDELMRQRREEAAERLRARVGDYLTAQLELQKYPEEGFDQVLAKDDLIPASVRRWRDYLHQTKGSLHPILAPWQVLAELPEQDVAPQGEAVLAQLFRARGSELNPLVTKAFASPPKSMREVASRYGALFSEVDKQWATAQANAKQAGADAPGRLTDDAAEALRQFLLAPDSPTTVPDVAIVDNELFFPTSVVDELWKAQGEVDRWAIRQPEAPAHALILQDGAMEPQPRIFLRGNPATKGREVPRQFLGLLTGEDRQPFANGSGRLELAKDITSPSNPLTARVMVNRIWQHHFGAGLVKTPSDYGVRAEPPSHPDLLDWLALRFVESGWSVKAMHRLILSSAVYQQGSLISDQHSVIGGSRSGGTGRPKSLMTATPMTDDSQRASALDPENRLLWHFNRQRLDFEQLRDSLLAASGELSPVLGGKPLGMFDQGNHRRSLYGLVDRQFLPPVFRAFDFASPDLHIPQRHETTVSQQALFFLNNPWVAGRAKTLAAGISISPPEAATRNVHQLYQSLFQRNPTRHEVEQGLQFISLAGANQPPPPPKPVVTAWTYGWGEYDEAGKRTRSFKPLPHFTGEAWQGGAKWPDAKLGWAQLTATGGHPGNDLQHACIRRWTAPVDVTVSISGTLVNEPEAGDGIRGFIVSSRLGELKAGEAHASQADMSVASVAVKAGDTLDFIVDIKKMLNSDQFLWAPVIKVESGGAENASSPAVSNWDAQREFGGTPESITPPLTPWEQYVQVLLLANEFLFVD